jgi:hypothetical protein
MVKKIVCFYMMFLCFFTAIGLAGCKNPDNDTTYPTYTVIYDGNGNTEGIAPVDTTCYEEGYIVTVLGNSGYLLKTGCNFAGWNTQADGRGTTYTYLQTFTMDAADVTLYTRWLDQWTNLSGVGGVDTLGNGISVDSAGSIYVTGLTGGALDGQALTGTCDVFVLKYDLTGTKQWTRLSGTDVGGATTIGYGISVDSAGNIYITGVTDGDLDGLALTGSSDVFVIKYDSAGVKQWTRLLGATGEMTRGYGISVDSAGNSYVTGFTYGDLDGLALTGLQDVFVIKYDSDGVKQWTRLLGVSSAITRGYGISVEEGSIYVTGYTTGDLDGQTCTGNQDVFIIKYDSAGVKQWIRLLGCAGTSALGRAISVAGGNIYVTGYTGGALDGQALTGLVDVPVIKYDSAGVKQWTRLSGTGGAFTTGYGISVDSGGNICVTGSTDGDLDGQIHTGTYDVYVIKYDSAGVKQWTKLMGAGGVQTEGNSIFVDSGGNIYVTGYTEGILDGQTCTGSKDVFVTTRLNN